MTSPILRRIERLPSGVIGLGLVVAILLGLEALRKWGGEEWRR